MATFLFVQDGVAIYEWSEPEGFVIDECFDAPTVLMFHLKGNADVGWTWDGSKFSPPVPPVIDVVALKARLKEGIDISAEVERLKYITNGVGQAMTYIEKAREAMQYLGATSPADADYPLLAAEVGITADTINGVAQVISQSFNEWRVIGAAIEHARLGTKKAIQDATTADEVNAAANAVIWPTP